jgi:serine/threonine protein kinase/WD40 repeat protein/Flp pilus assembly protein TadD
MNHPDAPSSADDAVGPVVEAFLDRFRRGERPSLLELVARHPQLADELQEIIPALVELEQIGGSTGSLSGSPADGSGSMTGNHPESLGDYRIIRQIGGGGMGVVYEAEHGSLKSRVALKVMHPRIRNDKKFLRRFNLEARAAAGLHHTNIVSVFDYGEQGGVCYYAMQYIKGQPLDSVLKDLRRLREVGPPEDMAFTRKFHGSGAQPAIVRPRSAAESLLTGQFAIGELPDLAPTVTGPGEASDAESAPIFEDLLEEEPETPREVPSFTATSLGGSVEGRYYRQVARVCARVADALDYAHRAGVLHRDVKPSNLLLDVQGNVWVTDFGLAKMEGGEDVSKSQDMVGTLRYMAPERFRGHSGRSGDIYALGATLYELVTLRPAFDGTDQVRLIDQIVHEPPQRPRLIDRHVPRDLETIILKALAKDAKDRFGSARELADELQRCADGLPTRSRPISPAERFGRWCKRNPLLATASITAATTTIALAIGATVMAKFYRDSRERYAAYAKDLEVSEIEGRKKLFEAKTSQAKASRFSRQPGQRFDSLDAITEAVKIGRKLGFPAEKFDRLRDQAIASMMLPDMKPAGPPIQPPSLSTAFAVNGGVTRYAFGRTDGTILVRRIGDDQEIARFTAKGNRRNPVFDFSLDGKYLAFGDGDTISIGDVDRKSLAWTVPGVCDGWAAGFSPDSRRIAVAPRGGTVQVYDLATGLSRSWNGPGPVNCLSFRPDGGAIAVVYAGNPAACLVLDAETGRQLSTMSNPPAGAVAWSPDGSTLALAGAMDVRGIHLFSATRGERGATLELPLALGGLDLSFHPAGTLLASNSWDGRLRLWDPATGRERLSLTGGGFAFKKDGRIFVSLGPEHRPWQVEAAVEYTTLRYASNRTLNHARASIHRDGRILAVGTDGGVILWDLARKTELGFLPIGNAWHSMFEPSGDLLSNGDAGVLRWAIQTDATSGEVRIGPPRILPLSRTYCEIATDQTGQIVAVAAHREAQVALGDRTIKIGPLDDCRGLSLSPDGKWLLTSNHLESGLMLWSLPDGARVPDLPFDLGGARFSPDGKWLVASTQGTCRIWQVGIWREVGQFEGFFQCFSPDGRLGIVRDMSSVLRLVEIETGRVLARLERPDQKDLRSITFSPDGSRLAGATNDPPSTEIIDLRAIRRRLVAMGLDWDAPAFPAVDTAGPDLPPLSPLKVDYGHLAPDLERYSVDDPGTLVERYTGRIRQNSDDFDAYHHRAHALAKLGRPAEAIDDLNRAIRLRPDDGHLLYIRAQIHAGTFRKWAPAIPDLEAALKLDPSQSPVRELLATCCNNLAWELAANLRSSADLGRALELSLRAVDLDPGKQVSLNTRGVVLFRAGKYAEAVTTLEKSLEAGKGQFDGFDLFFLAMAHHRLGHRVDARRCLDRAIDWASHASSLRANETKELAAFRAEAEAVLAGPIGELPDDVFGPP